MPSLNPEKYMRGEAKSGVENEKSVAIRTNTQMLTNTELISTSLSLNIISSIVVLVATLNYLGKRLDRD